MPKLDTPAAGSARHALVLGATGGFGAHLTAALLAHGWTVTAMARDPSAARARSGMQMPIDWVRGDAMVAGDVAKAAAGASLIVHAVNPPKYRNWAGTVLPMLENSIAAAKSVDARIVLPGTVYNYAPESGALVAEDAPQVPTTRKGVIRARMEARLAEEAVNGVRSLVMRAGDFFGPAVENSALARMILKLRGRAAAMLRAGPRDVGHAYAYLPDLARATAMVLEKEPSLANFETFHFSGDWLTPNELLAALREVTGQPRLPSLPFPWLVVWMAAGFDETMRELLEMRYLSQRPIGLAGDKLAAFLGETPRTPFHRALRATLTDAAEAAPPCGQSMDGLAVGWTRNALAT